MLMNLIHLLISCYILTQLIILRMKLLFQFYLFLDALAFKVFVKLSRISFRFLINLILPSLFTTLKIWICYPIKFYLFHDKLLFTIINAPYLLLEHWASLYLIKRFIFRLYLPIIILLFDARTQLHLNFFVLVYSSNECFPSHIWSLFLTQFIELNY